MINTNYELNLVRYKDIVGKEDLDENSRNLEEVAYADIVNLPSYDTDNPNNTILPNTRLGIRSVILDQSRIWYTHTASGAPFTTQDIDHALMNAIAHGLARNMAQDLTMTKADSGADADIVAGSKAESDTIKDGDTISVLWQGRIHVFMVKIGEGPVGGTVRVVISTRYSHVYPYLASHAGYLLESPEALKKMFGFTYRADGWYSIPNKPEVVFLVIKVPCQKCEFTKQEHCLYAVSVWMGASPYINMMTLLTLPVYPIAGDEFEALAGKCQLEGVEDERTKSGWPFNILCPRKDND